MTNHPQVYRERGWSLFVKEQLMVYVQLPARPKSRLPMPEFAELFFPHVKNDEPSRMISIQQSILFAAQRNLEPLKETTHHLTRNPTGRISFSKFRSLHPGWSEIKTDTFYKRNRYMVGFMKITDEEFYAIPVPSPLTPRMANKVARRLAGDEALKILSDLEPFKALQELVHLGYHQMNPALVGLPSAGQI